MEAWVGLCVEVVEHQTAFLLLPEPQITRLCEFRICLPAVRFGHDAVAVDERHLLPNVVLVNHGNTKVSLDPALPHDALEGRHLLLRNRHNRLGIYFQVVLSDTVGLFAGREDICAVAAVWRGLLAAHHFILRRWLDVGGRHAIGSASHEAVVYRL